MLSREIKPKLPDVRFVDREVISNVNLIRSADVIWIQTDVLCHDYFYNLSTSVWSEKTRLRCFFVNNGICNCRDCTDMVKSN